MKMTEASDYVQQNARYMADAPDESKYFVRWPTTNSIAFFYSNTYDLAVQVFKFANTKRGREIGKILEKHG